MGRYLTQDPIKLAGGLNQYAYVDGNPVNWVDPLGLFAVDKSGAEEVLARTDGVPVLPEAGKGATEIVNNPLEWNSWQNYPKTTVNGKKYAQVGDRLYSQHAVDRMQPSGLGSPAGTVGAGRNISPKIVEHTIKNGTKTHTTVNNIERILHWSGDVGVVTENNSKVVITILRRSEK